MGVPNLASQHSQNLRLDTETTVYLLQKTKYFHLCTCPQKQWLHQKVGLCSHPFSNIMQGQSHCLNLNPIWNRSSKEVWEVQSVIFHLNARGTRRRVEYLLNASLPYPYRMP